MSADTWFIIAIAMFVLAGLLLAAAVIVFFVLKIPDIIGELSGRNYAKEVKRMREENENSGPKYTVFDGNTSGTSGSYDIRKEYTNSMESGPSGYPGKADPSGIAKAVSRTAVPPTDMIKESASLASVSDTALMGRNADAEGDRPTDLLNGAAQFDDDDRPTDLLNGTVQFDDDDRPTDVLNGAAQFDDDDRPTDLLCKPDDKTAELSNEAYEYSDPGATEIFTNTSGSIDDSFVITRSVKEVHTDEVIG